MPKSRRTGMWWGSTRVGLCGAKSASFFLRRRLQVSTRASNGAVSLQLADVSDVQTTANVCSRQLGGRYVALMIGASPLSGADGVAPTQDGWNKVHVDLHPRRSTPRRLPDGRVRDGRMWGESVSTSGPAIFAPASTIQVHSFNTELHRGVEELRALAARQGPCTRGSGAAGAEMT